MNLEPAFAGSGQQPPIQSYGGGGFRLAGKDYRGSILVSPDGVLEWPVRDATELAVDALLSQVRPHGDHMLLVGCGAGFVPPPAGFLVATRKAGLVPEWMDTGAACRTYNILLSEDRLVVAALIAVE